LREALLVLVGRGLFQARRGGGYGVTDVTGPTITDPLVHLLQRHPCTADDVLELRHGLECVAAYFAAIRAGDDDAQRLRDMAAAMKRRRTRRDPLEDAELDVQFHMAVAEASHNVALVHVMRGLFNLMRNNMMRSREVLYRQPENVVLLDEQHAQIVKAIVARDHDAARQAANLHLSFIQASLRENSTAPRRTASRRHDASAAEAVRKYR
jgi:GntR family transcriptional repressor for pyruvate dehydrogenase complex